MRIALPTLAIVLVALVARNARAQSDAAWAVTAGATAVVAPGGGYRSLGASFGFSGRAEVTPWSAGGWRVGVEARVASLTCCGGDKVAVEGSPPFSSGQTMIEHFYAVGLSTRYDLLAHSAFTPFVRASLAPVFGSLKQDGSTTPARNFAAPMAGFALGAKWGHAFMAADGSMMFGVLGDHPRLLAVELGYAR
jgi:hypothetical protein